ncbi:MAG: Mur ligase family protein [Prolixibacteraceae bacterium]|jgi:UDP-N-acetylmuramate: L-alanyl-gamma-D-glutamyl-meso-diaminopimelate ligase|nr:Mur ligase family protein [Prolixibacteraceae bacterium]
MHIHFIAIGGSAMHNLAIVLKQKGYKVTGSDDEIFEPSHTRLLKHGLLPPNEGWYPEKIEGGVDAVILGMHARPDNPELLKARELGVKIYSYPEYLYEQTKFKKRIVIGGSHGKTTVTSMVMHVLKACNVNFDYMVGANIEGFETMVRLSDDAEIAVFEGDEYLSSPIDVRPKFHHYRPDIALLTGIAWDHINVFPTFEGYMHQFELFVELIAPKGTLIYFEDDKHLKRIADKVMGKVMVQPYTTPEFSVEENQTILRSDIGDFKLEIFGRHNMQNLGGAKLICRELGITDRLFYEKIASFKGSSRRLEKIAETDESTVFYDFAHSPSKLKATTDAVKSQFPNRKLVAVMELHTFSSLKKEFLPEYHNAMLAADKAFVYFNPQTIAHKKLEPISKKQVEDAFGGGVKSYTNADELFENLGEQEWKDTNLLIMTSGNFSGKDVKVFGQELIRKQ